MQNKSFSFIRVDTKTNIEPYAIPQPKKWLIWGLGSKKLKPTQNLGQNESQNTMDHRKLRLFGFMPPSQNSF